ncbi:phosphatidylserine/phosphatidylglycerophosphate/cardiolipin synthase [Galbibacter orientalis DSM 19592]|uniref:Cardiolipin synthase n=1 Tax=Galbibacter orientalis DSM 19592 TaxID=926559 RepID=I3CAZ5_9FLAO|nr:cardiolipin synthase [Galbibacter orientalis]EIJ40788.1 phosphatidylserine/phosphatidylglycerophosphate/cardiolipin synthase [Galbibacter orientalis DSM 19592]
MWAYISDHLWQFLLGLNYVLALIAAVTILLKNINPTKTLSYLIALLAFPFVGLIVYFFFGQDYRKFKIFKKKNVLNQRNIRDWAQQLVLNKKEAYDIGSHLLNGNTKIIKLIDSEKRSPLTLNNKVKILINGEEKFNSLFADLKEAKSSIHLEYYIIRDDEIGTKIINLLCEKAAEGVSVKINYDSVASSFSNQSISFLKNSGVEMFPFMPVYFPKFASKANYRNHRKMVIIDGKIGYVGGINIGDEYINKEGRRYWRDTHIRIEGQAVGMLQFHFSLDWDFVSENDIKIDKSWFPETEVSNKIPIQIAASGPDTEWANIMEAMFTAINSASRYVYITTPYFIPNDEISLALSTASKSGVDVRLIIPKSCDSWAAKYATYSYLEKLLRAGVKIYLYEKGNIHAKTMIVDDVFTTIGTSNMDYRSFHINFEVNALIYDEDITKQMLEIYIDDLQYSEQVDAERWLNRGLIQRLKESFCRLWAPLL